MDQVLLEKYQKKLLLLKEISKNIESKVLFYTKKVDINLKSALKLEENLSLQEQSDA
ncbi:hypothetical protein GW891_02965, partial [bacterium]|nr:hypothetical protein [bacterium]